MQTHELSYLGISTIVFGMNDDTVEMFAIGIGFFCRQKTIVTCNTKL